VVPAFASHRHGEDCRFLRDDTLDPAGDLRVEDARDIVAVERTRSSRPYHVLGGAISADRVRGP